MSTDNEQAEHPHPPPRIRWYRTFGGRVGIGVVAYIVLGGLGLMFLPDLLLTNWFPDLGSEQRARHLGSAANVVLFALGGVIAVIGVGLSLSRHREELQAAVRDQARLQSDLARETTRVREVETQRRVEAERILRERFITVVATLSDASPVNRQAALYALGALADDWEAFGAEDEVQVCIEVLTGYLRAPLPAQEAWTPRPEIPVKQAGYAILRKHLERCNVARGGTLAFDGAEIVRGSVVLAHSTIQPGGRVDFQNAKLAERANIRLDHVSVSDKGVLSLADAELKREARVYFSNGKVKQGGLLSFQGLTLSGSRVYLLRSTADEGAVVDFDYADIDGGSSLHLGSASMADNTLSFDFASIRAGARLVIGKANLGDFPEAIFRGADVENPRSLRFATPGAANEPAESDG